MKAIGDPFDDLDLVVDALQFAGVYLMLAMADDSILMTLELLGEFHQCGMAVPSGNLAPLGRHLHRPAWIGVIPDVGRQILDPFSTVAFRSFRQERSLRQRAEALALQGRFVVGWPVTLG